MLHCFQKLGHIFKVNRVFCSLNDIEIFVYIHLRIKFTISSDLVVINMGRFPTINQFHRLSPFIFMQLKVNKFIKILK